MVVNIEDITELMSESEIPLDDPNYIILILLIIFYKLVTKEKE